jgi:hypothetical protein
MVEGAHPRRRFAVVEPSRPEPYLIRRIDPDGTHWQPKVDRGSNGAPGTADRRGLIRREHRRFDETLDHGHSGQGAESREAISDRCGKFVIFVEVI